MERTIYKSQVGQILIDADSIASAISALARQITSTFKQSQDVSVIVLLDGAKRFADDLFGFINDGKFRLEYIDVKSYNGTESAGAVEINGDLPNLEGADVLIIDDIYDSGTTMKHMTETVKSHNPGIVKTCVLLKKQTPRDYADVVDFYAFDIPDCFVVGYGLDYNGQYRQLSYIAELCI